MNKKIKIIRPVNEVKNTISKLKVCAYCRVSTESDEQSNSYETQKSYYEQLISSNPNWELVGIYADKGSGLNTEQRAEFKDMLEDCELGKIDLILTKSISRFARNTLDTVKISRELKAKSIYIHFEKENINTESELAFNLMASFAQMESESISKNVKQAIQRQFKNGEFKVVNAPFGYKKSGDGNVVICEEEAEIIRLIFKMYIEGKSGTKISEYLNNSNFFNRQNTKWRPTLTSTTIKNEFYIGTRILQKSYIEWNDNIKKVNRGELPQFVEKNHHEAIISNEDFKKANEILDIRRKQINVASVKVVKFYQNFYVKHL